MSLLLYFLCHQLANMWANPRAFQFFWLTDQPDESPGCNEYIWRICRYIFNTLDGRYFIQKPIENEELIARLNKIIRIYINNK